MKKRTTFPVFLLTLCLIAFGSAAGAKSLDLAPVDVNPLCLQDVAATQELSAGEAPAPPAEESLELLHEPILLSGGSCSPIPPLCQAVDKVEEYCGCVNAGGNPGLCRCVWCLGMSAEECKITFPI